MEIATDTAPQPLHRTEKLAVEALKAAVASADEAKIHLTKSAIAVFCKCALAWLTAKETTTDKLKARITAESKELAASLIADDLDAAGVDSAAPAGCAAASAAVTVELANASANLEEHVWELHRAMVDGCIEVTNAFIASDAFRDDLKELRGEAKYAFETGEFVQVAQKCMRCSSYIFAGEKTTADPYWKNCASHTACIPADELAQYQVWKAGKSAAAPGM